MISLRTQMVAAFAAVFVLAVADMSFAQPGRGRGFDRGGMTGLLQNEKVQEELELVDDQIEDLREMQRAMWEDMRENFRGRGFRDMDDDEREQADVIRLIWQLDRPCHGWREEEQ